MNIVGLIILAVIGNKLLKGNKNKPEPAPRQRSYSASEPQTNARKTRETRSSRSSEKVDTLSETAILSSLQLVSEYQKMSPAQRSELESLMNTQTKAQFYHLYNSLWKMTDMQQMEYVTQQSRNGLYYQIGNFALRHYDMG